MLLKICQVILNFSQVLHSFDEALAAQDCARHFHQVAGGGEREEG